MAGSRLAGFGDGGALDLVTVAAAVSLLDHVAGYGQPGDDAAGAVYGDARLVAQLRAWWWAMHNSIPGWLVRKLQLVTLKSHRSF